MCLNKADVCFPRLFFKNLPKEVGAVGLLFFNCVFCTLFPFASSMGSRMTLLATMAPLSRSCTSVRMRRTEGSEKSHFEMIGYFQQLHLHI